MLIICSNYTMINKKIIPIVKHVDYLLIYNLITILIILNNNNMIQIFEYQIIIFILISSAVSAIMTQCAWLLY